MLKATTLSATSKRLSEVAYLDMSIHCTSGNPWLGTWSNYPFLNSGNIIVTVIEMGLFIVKVLLNSFLALSHV